MERLVHGGGGLVRLEGKVGFVRDVIPGETVRIEIVSDRPTRFEAELVEILQSSPDRVVPRCELFGRCGGCDWQHISDESQTGYRKQILVEDLRRLGGIAVVDDSVGVVSGGAWDYRGRVQIHRGTGGEVGFRRRGSHQVVPVRFCPVARPAVNQFLARNELSDRGTPDRGARDRRAPDSRTILVEDDHGVREGTPGEPTREPAVRTVAGQAIRFDPAAFFQSTVPLLDDLAEIVRRAAGSIAPRTLIDLYAGAGLLAVAAAVAAEPGTRHKDGEGEHTPERLPEQIVCVEEDQRNARFIRENLVGAGVPDDSVTVVHGAVEKAIRGDVLNRTGSIPAGSTARTDTVLIVDPPRGGLSPVVRQWVCRNRFARVIYLSCDSSALARDLRELRQVYSLTEIVLLDFYPQTAHVETLVLLDRSTAP